MILAPTMQQRWGGRAFLLELGEFPCYQIRGEFHIWFWVVEMEKKISTSLFENSSSCHCPNWGHARWRGEWGWSRGKMEKQVQQMNNIQQCCHKDFSLGQQLQKYLKIIELIYSFVLCQHSKSVFASRIIAENFKIWGLGMCQQMLKISGVTYATTKRIA